MFLDLASLGRWICTCRAINEATSRCHRIFSSMLAASTGQHIADSAHTRSRLERWTTLSQILWRPSTLTLDEDITGRYLHRLAIASSKGALLFGGQTGNSVSTQCIDEVLHLTTSNPMLPTLSRCSVHPNTNTPEPRASATFLAVDGNYWMFGGVGANAMFLKDLWKLQTGDNNECCWELVDPSGDWHALTTVTCLIALDKNEILHISTLWSRCSNP